MFHELYEEVAQEASSRIREDEKRAFRHAIALMEQAKAAGPSSRQSVEALFFVNRLWGVLLQDLAHHENELPADLRARLISIGIWILRRVEDIRFGRSTDFDALIEVSQTICKGLDTKS